MQSNRAESKSQMGSLRHVVVGVGAHAFRHHRPALLQTNVNLVGVCDTHRDSGQQRADESGCPFFSDYRTMLAETQPEVAVIMTPHPAHAPIAIDCLEAGCHVLVEKPMATHIVEADMMIQAAAQNARLLAVNFQHRYRPEVAAARKLIQEGHLGRIQHISMITTWTRTISYYQMSSWRGT